MSRHRVSGRRGLSAFRPRTENCVVNRQTVERQRQEEGNVDCHLGAFTPLALPYFPTSLWPRPFLFLMQSISIRLPCVMHGGSVIRPAVADVHIKINAPLAMRNFHPSRERPKRQRVSLKIHAAKAGRRGICITNAQTASNEIHQSVLRRMNGSAR